MTTTATTAARSTLTRPPVPVPQMAPAAAPSASAAPSGGSCAGVTAVGSPVSACSVRLDLANSGDGEVLLEVRNAGSADVLHTYLVPAGGHRSGYLRTGGDGSYDLEVHGPDGLVVRLAGAPEA